MVSGMYWTVIWYADCVVDVPVNTNHFPDVLTKQGLLELLQLQCYVILFPAFDHAKYAEAPKDTSRYGVPLKMHQDRYREYQYALYCVERLQMHLDYQLKVSLDDGFVSNDTSLESYETISQVCCFFDLTTPAALI